MVGENLVFFGEVLLLLCVCSHAAGAGAVFPVPDPLPDFCDQDPDILINGPFEWIRKANARIQLCMEVRIPVICANCFCRISFPSS